MFDFLIKWKINSALKNNKKEHAFRNMESMKSLLILFSYDDWKETYQIAQDLERRGKKVVMWTISPKKQDLSNTIFPENVRVIHPRDLSYFQILTPVLMNEFKHLVYDTLIDMTTTSNNVFQYLLAVNSAEFCIGITESDGRIFDFTIIKEEEKNLQETYEQIKFYLNNLR